MGRVGKKTLNNFSIRYFQIHALIQFQSYIPQIALVGIKFALSQNFGNTLIKLLGESNRRKSFFKYKIINSTKYSRFVLL